MERPTNHISFKFINDSVSVIINGVELATTITQGLLWLLHNRRDFQTDLMWIQFVDDDVSFATFTETVTVDRDQLLRQLESRM
jgi:hypothetical protein